MGEQMNFPDTLDEFIKQYSFIDRKEIYTNGSELIQTFRVKQWEEHRQREYQELKYQEVYKKTKDYTRNDFVIELIKKDDEKQELIEFLKERELELKENVRTYEEKLRQTPRESFYYNSYLKTLHRYRAKRELIKEILSKI